MFGVGVGIRVGGRTPVGGSAYDADAQAFFDRVTTAGGTLSTTEKNATNQLVLDMKSAGIWTAMKAVYPMVGSSAAACAQNLKSSSFTGTFTSGWTFSSNGAKPNGTSAYMNTGFNPATNLTTTNFSISVYRNTFNILGGTDIGMYSGSSSYYYLGSTSTTESAIAFQGFGNTYAETSHLGLFTLNALSGITKGYKNGITKLSYSTTGLVPSANSFLGANAFGGGSEFTNHQYAFASYNDGLTDTQASNFYTAVQAFQVSLSRSV